VPPRYFTVPRTYYFPPIDVRMGFYYHPFFGFYYGPYYGPYYPYPGPFLTATRYSVSAIRLKVQPVETEVYLNGYYAGIVDDFDGVFQRLYAPAGQHQIELRLDGYKTFRQGVWVASGDTLEVTHRMEHLASGEQAPAPPGPLPLPDDWGTTEARGATEQPASPYGVLAIRTEPADAQIVIDGEAWEAPAGQHEFVIHLPPGWHQLEVRKADYRPFATGVQLNESQTTRLSVRLDK